MNIVSQIKINGKWVNQDQIPEAVAKQVIQAAICRGMKQIGFTLTKDPNEKTA